MFGEQFYPTPSWVIEKMLKPFEFSFEGRFGTKKCYKLGDRKILEPSAGKGDIVDFISGHAKSKNIYAIEIDPNLQSILREKNIKVIGEDFLDYEDDYFVDMVIMNPPFANGVDHVLKAWDVLTLGGDIIALVNAETVLNPYSEKRKLLLRYIEEYGSYELLGNCFSDSERKTDVDVALIRLSKPRVENPFNFDSEFVKDDEIKLDEEVSSNEIAINDVIGTMIRNYEKSKEAYVDYIRARKKLLFYSEPIVPKLSSVITMANESLKDGDVAESYNNFLDEFKKLTWKKITSMIGIEKLMTSSVNKNFDKFLDGQKSMAINKENIKSLVMMLYGNSKNIMEQAVIDVFDIFTKYHDENRIHLEGWKTNDAWRVNKKVILPNYVTAESYSKNFTTCYRRYSEYSDIDKVMCYLSGKKIESILRIDDVIRAFPIGSRDWLESEFFKIKCFKKGTLHIVFKDEWLWAEFNQRACIGKKWLGN